tara:strand:- start:180 stop:524 length:345 start_codon:yes stop_codon:yes gene_type:complete
MEIFAPQYPYVHGRTAFLFLKNEITLKFHFLLSSKQGINVTFQQNQLGEKFEYKGKFKMCNLNAQKPHDQTEVQKWGFCGLSLQQSPVRKVLFHGSFPICHSTVFRLHMIWKEL